MDELAAYRLLQKHPSKGHTWELIAENYDWCPECGAVRATPEAVDA